MPCSKEGGKSRVLQPSTRVLSLTHQSQDKDRTVAASVGLRGKTNTMTAPLRLERKESLEKSIYTGAVCSVAA